MFSAYKAGRFTGTDDSGIPAWEFNDDDKTPSHVEFGYDDLIRDDFGTSLTIFILPGNITEFQMFDVHGNRIAGSDDISNEIQKKRLKQESHISSRYVEHRRIQIAVL